MENLPVKKMRIRTPAKLLLAGVFLAALIAVPFFGHGTEINIPGLSQDTGGTASASVVPATPARIRIPDLGIDTNVLEVGLTKEGKMDSPKSSTAVGWYKFGAKPGEQGNAVIAGHVNTYYDTEGVFYNLEDLAVGNTVEITDAAGQIFRFQVTAKKYLDHNSSPNDVFGPTSERNLNLVTCAGDWLKDKKTFEQRLVIFTELVE